MSQHWCCFMCSASARRCRAQCDVFFIPQLVTHLFGRIFVLLVFLLLLLIVLVVVVAVVAQHILFSHFCGP